MIFPQLLLDLHDELIVDLFAGGGGASLGIEMATGRMVDIAINHDPVAVAMHRANHPLTRHILSDVFEADPREVTRGRPVGLLWASPDCTYHSKARGAKPIRHKNKKRRSLAWVVTRWAGTVRPRVIALENVEEFADWCPLVARRDPATGRVIKGYRTDSRGRKVPIVAEPGERVPVDQQELVPDHRRAGETFRKWVRSLKRLGYVVEWRQLRACDYGAPTIRRRLFLIARCDGRPIVWPEPTHGPGRRYPYRTAAECIDWSIPMLSIFATPQEAREWAKMHRVGVPVRPLAPATLRRIARGVVRFVLQTPEPFIVGVGGRMGQSPPRPLGEPYHTTTTKGDAALVVPYLVPRYGERPGQDPRTRSVDDPAPVVVPTGNGAQLVAAFLAQHNTGLVGHDARDPVSTIVTKGCTQALVTATLLKNKGTGSAADVGEPLHTVVAGGTHHGLIAAHLQKFQENGAGVDSRQPLHTVMAGAARHAIVAAHIQRDFGMSVGQPAGTPLGTVTANGGGKAALVAAFLQSYYGAANRQDLREPLRTIPTHDRFGLVTVEIAGEPYVIVDIAMRMLQPRELYRAQGFPDSYIIDRGADGRRLSKTEQVHMVGNSVCPQVAAALVRANVPELIARDEALVAEPRRKVKLPA